MITFAQYQQEAHKSFLEIIAIPTLASWASDPKHPQHDRAVALLPEARQKLDDLTNTLGLAPS